MISRIALILELLDASTRRRIPISVLVSVLVSISEAVGIGLIFPVLLALSEPSRIKKSPWLGWLYERVGASSVEQFIAIIGGTIVTLLILKNVLMVVVTRWQVSLIVAQESALSERLFERYLRMPFEKFVLRNSPDLIQAVSGEVSTAISAFLLPAMGVLVEVAVVIGLIAVVVIIDPFAALAIFCTMGVAALILNMLMRRWMRSIGERLIVANTNVLRRLQEGIVTSKEIRVLGRTSNVVADYVQDRRALSVLRGTHTFIGSLPRAYLEITLLLSLVLVAVALIARRPLYEAVSVLAVFGGAGLRLLPSANRVLSLLQHMSIAGPAVDKVVQEFRDTEPGGQRKSEISASMPAAERVPLQAAISVEAVHYSYPGQADSVLRGLDLQIARGTSTGLVGLSGAGKSTLVDILLGLRSPKRGCVRADGRDISEELRSWQDRIGYVPQRIALVDATIRQNIALGIPETEIDQSRVQRAAEKAQLSAFLADLPHGFDTIIGEGGARLSGGQQQRIGIARALYNNPEFLILDEATSALDNTTEQRIAAMLSDLAGDATLLIVAHRLSTLRRCDRIVLLKDGVCAGQGSFDDLSASNDDFAALVRDGMRESNLMQSN